MSSAGIEDRFGWGFSYDKAATEYVYFALSIASGHRQRKLYYKKPPQHRYG